MKNLTIDDITTWNWVRNSFNTFSFSIDKLKESEGFDEDFACNLEYFISSEGYIADEFNIEYMGILTGKVNCSKETLIVLIDDFLKNRV